MADGAGFEPAERFSPSERGTYERNEPSRNFMDFLTGSDMVPTFYGMSGQRF
jgi:hypothetical protein